MCQTYNRTLEEFKSPSTGYNFTKWSTYNRTLEEFKLVSWRMSRISARTYNRTLEEFKSGIYYVAEEDMILIIVP